MRPVATGNRMCKRLALLVALVAVLASAWLGAEVAYAAASNCGATKGEVRHQSGPAPCAEEGQGSVAHANGDGSTATATGGDHNHAQVIGDISDSGFSSSA